MLRQAIFRFDRYTKETNEGKWKMFSIAPSGVYSMLYCIVSFVVVRVLLWSLNRSCVICVSAMGVFCSAALSC